MFFNQAVQLTPYLSGRPSFRGNAILGEVRSKKESNAEFGRSCCNFFTVEHGNNIQSAGWAVMARLACVAMAGGGCALLAMASFVDFESNESFFTARVQVQLVSRGRSSDDTYIVAVKSLWRSSCSGLTSDALLCVLLSSYYTMVLLPNSFTEHSMQGRAQHRSSLAVATRQLYWHKSERCTEEYMPHNQRHCQRI